MLFSSPPTHCVLYHSALEYEEEISLMVDECFLYRYRDVFFNISVRADPKVYFYCVIRGSYIGIFNGWYVVLFCL